jgi:triacylglycerol lipase
MSSYPSLGLSDFLGEGRFFGEYLKFRSDAAINVPVAANDNWRPIFLIPGFLAGDSSLYPLGSRLSTQGHRVYYSGIWINADCPSKTLDRLQKRLQEIARSSGRKVILIGHSLGGIYARELARREPKLVERAFLLGSPVGHTDSTTPFLRPFIAAMKLIHGRCMTGLGRPCDVCGVHLPDEAPSVPETVIYTKSDGIVDWHSCIDHGDYVECVEVNSSHCGIPLNLKTWDVICNRLAMPIEEPDTAPRHSNLVQMKRPSRAMLRVVRAA